MMSVEPARVSVVMPVLDGAATIGGQLEALSCQTYPDGWEIVVVDNGSVDGTDAIVAAWQERMPRLRLHRSSETRGANHARNVGCEVASGSLLAFCDHDDLVDPGWLAAIVRGLAVYPAVGGFIERELLNDEVAVATRPQRAGLLDGFGFLPYPLAANCGVRREVWTFVGGFDPAFRHGSDDVEFFWRAQLAGYQMGFLPDAVVHYRLRPDVAGMARQYYSYGRSHARLFRRFRPDGMPRSGLRSGAAAWWGLAVSAPGLVRSRRDRAVWLTRSALHWGRIVGSLQQRVLYL